MNHHRQEYSPDSRLWLALRLPALPLNVLGLSATNEQPVVVIEKQHIVCASDAACKAGVKTGMNLTRAQLLSDCEAYLRDPDLETKALAALAQQLYQFTPHIETYICPFAPQAGLRLEISRCLALFAGVNALSARIFNYLRTTHYQFEYGLAHSAQGAWLLSFVPFAIAGNEDTDLFCARLKALPIQLLQDYPQAVEALEKTGFTTLGDIARQIDAQSLSSIRKRLWKPFAQYIQDIFGIEQNLQQKALFDKPLAVLQPITFFMESIDFDYPITLTEQLHFPIETLLQKLSDYLRKRQFECQHIEWTLLDIFRNSSVIDVHCDSGQSSWELLYDLTLIQLDNRDLPFEVDSIKLACRTTSPLQNSSLTLAFDSHRQSRNAGRSLAISLAKLKARLGDAAVCKLSYRDSLLPELSNALIPVNETCNQQLPDKHRKGLRPTWLLPSPIQIEERQNGLYWRGYLQILLGPDRIRSNWWQTPVARDYFLAKRNDNVRLWIYLDLLQKNWYVHGVFA